MNQETHSVVVQLIGYEYRFACQPAERDEFMARYKAAAGFAKDRLNSAAPTIAPGATVPA